MKVRSPLLFEMAGKLGNAVAANARGGITYFRALVTPTNPSSFLQTAVRNALQSAAAYWKNTLTEAQQEAWWDGASGSQTGQTLFTKVNQPRVYASNTERFEAVDGGAIGGFERYLVEPPESIATTLLPPTAIVIDDSANQIQINTTELNDAYQVGAGEDFPTIVYVYASHQQNASRFSRQHSYQLLRAFMWTNGGDPIPNPLTVNLAALGLTTEAGKIMYVKTQVQAPDGSLSTPIEQRIVITA